MTLSVILVVGCDEQINKYGTPSFDYLYLIDTADESSMILSNGSYIYIPVYGGESSTYIIKADGEYNITQPFNNRWFTITRSERNNEFYLSADANITEMKRVGSITIALTSKSSEQSTEITLNVSQDACSPDLSYFLCTNELILARKYLMVCNAEKVCVWPVNPSSNYGYLPAKNVEIKNNVITQEDNANVFTFATSVTIDGKTYNLSNGQFMIVDSNHRYYYMSRTHTSFNVSDSPTITDGKIDSSYLFTATCNSEGLWMIQNIEKGKWIQYDPDHSSWGCYSDLRYILPSLYIQAH